MYLMSESESSIRVGITDGFQAKTGVGIRTTLESVTCPTACPFRSGNGCYAEDGTVSWYWAKINKGTAGVSWADFIAKLRTFPRAQWRHAQAGDHAGHANKLDREKCVELARANDGRPVVSYSHYPVTDGSRESLFNLATFREMARLGFSVNASTESLGQADVAISRGMPAVCVVSEDSADVQRTPAGNVGVWCPAQRTDGKVTCFGGKGTTACGGGRALCGRSADDRVKADGTSWLVLFKVHGVKHRKANATLERAA